jgi:hypothetical protein
VLLLRLVSLLLQQPLEPKQPTLRRTLSQQPPKPHTTPPPLPNSYFSDQIPRSSETSHNSIQLLQQVRNEDSNLLKLHYTLHHFLPLLLLHSLYDDYSVKLRVHRPLLNCSLVLQATFLSGSQGCALFPTQLIQCVWNLKNSWWGGSQLPLCSPWPIDDASIPLPRTTRGRTLPCPEAVRRPGMPVEYRLYPVPTHSAGRRWGPRIPGPSPPQPFVDWSVLALPPLDSPILLLLSACLMRRP